MNRPKFDGKTKKELTYEAFGKYGSACTKKQWADYLVSKGAGKAHSNVFYMTRRQAQALKDAPENPGRFLKANKIPLQLYTALKAFTRQEVVPVPAVPPVSVRESGLAGSIRRYHQFSALVDRVGQDVIDEVTALIDKVGAEDVKEMLGVYKELKKS